MLINKYAHKHHVKVQPERIWMYLNEHSDCFVLSSVYINFYYIITALLLFFR